MPGAEGRNRTIDTRIFSPLLYRLSYLGPSDSILCFGVEDVNEKFARVTPASGLASRAFQVFVNAVSQSFVLQQVKRPHTPHLRRIQRAERHIDDPFPHTCRQPFPLLRGRLLRNIDDAGFSEYAMPATSSRSCLLSTKPNAGSVQTSYIRRGGYDMTKPPCSSLLMPGPTTSTPGAVE